MTNVIRMTGFDQNIAIGSYLGRLSYCGLVTTYGDRDPGDGLLSDCIKTRSLTVIDFQNNLLKPSFCKTR